MINRRILLKINKKFNLFYNRKFHISSVKFSEVRVRFAPSPTGFLHLGGLRTALYNYLFAKSHNGTFILRIEDTDQTRIIEKGVESLIKDLEWAGLNPDEGPHVGGNYGPYIQSQRLHLYKNHVDKLLLNGSAYKCFCSDRRLELLKRNLFGQGRFQDVEPFEDLIYGPILYNVAESEGDPVILKSDGYPTYHLANIVDDHYMKITHVLRGIEWQISTPKHILLYRASGWEPPKYAHLPLITNADGTKLSKRQGDINIRGIRDSGIFPFSLLQYVTQAGGGFHQASQFAHSLQDLVKNFDLKLLNKHSCRLSPPKLQELNNLELKRKLKEEKLLDELIEELKIIVYQKFKDKIDSGEIIFDPDHTKKVLKWSQDRINSLHDLLDTKLHFIWTRPKDLNFNEIQIDEQISDKFFDHLYEHIENVNNEKFTKEYFVEFLKDFSKKNKIKYNLLMKFLRYSLSGLKEGPGVGEMIQILGKDCTLSRLSIAKAFLKQNKLIK